MLDCCLCLVAPFTIDFTQAQMLRRVTIRARNFAIPSEDTMRKSSTPFFKVDVDLLDQYEKMQVGSYKEKLIQDKAAIEAEKQLPLPERVRIAMVRNNSFSVDLVKAAGMDTEAEYVRFNRAIRQKNRAASKQFYMYFVWLVLACASVYYFFGVMFY